MTRRNEIKKDLERGWVHNIVAMAFLQVDLSVLEEMTRQGIVSSSLDRSSTLYKLDDVMNGNLTELVGALNQEHQAEELASQVE